MKPTWQIAALALFSFTLSCGNQTVLSSNANSNPQKLPFDRPAKAAGISPSHSLIPSATRIPEGTAVTVSLEHSLSSASAQSNDTFAAVLDEPIVIDGQTVVPGGALVTGRVLDARSASPSLDRAGYLRIALVALSVNGKQVPVPSSSLFAKGGSREERGAVTTPASDDAGIVPKMSAPKEMVFAPGRRLTFRLTQNVDLQ